MVEISRHKLILGIIFFGVIVLLPPTYITLLGLQNPTGYTYTISEVQSDPFLSPGSGPSEVYVSNAYDYDKMSSTGQSIVNGLIESDKNSKEVSPAQHAQTVVEHPDIAYVYYEEEWYQLDVTTEEAGCGSILSCFSRGLDVFLG